MRDVAYYQRRLAEELSAIASASCSKAAEAHREMAEHYRILLDGLTAAKAIKVDEIKPDAETPAR